MSSFDQRMTDAYNKCSKGIPGTNTGGATCSTSTPGPVPREGAESMAENQVQSINARMTDAIVDHLIHARNVGHREGKEDAEAQQMFRAHQESKWLEEIRVLKSNNENLRYRNSNQLDLINGQQESLIRLNKIIAGLQVQGAEYERQIGALSLLCPPLHWLI